MPSSELPVLPAQGWVACCSPLTGEPLDLDAAERLAGVLKALAEPTRLRLLSLIAAQPGREACICDLTAPVALSQPTVSHHMKVLTDAGLLQREQRGKWAHYRLVPDALDALASALAATTGSQPRSKQALPPPAAAAPVGATTGGQRPAAALP